MIRPGVKPRRRGGSRTALLGAGKEEMMGESTKTSWNFVWVTDRRGNEFICPVDALRDPGKATPEELDNCLEDAKAEMPLGD
jgi:hypothetical protein